MLARIHLHRLHVGRRRSPEDLNDLDHLVHVIAAVEEGLAGDHLGDHAAERPHVDLGSVLGALEDEFGSSVVARADIGDTFLPFAEDLGGTEVAELHVVGFFIDQYV